ncbi:flagellar hook-associated protein FlgL [Nocardioides sp. zg-1228]|uniref:flagellar hook-associated protein FlgL n=1 Tax=Nocardioides sp. zg-1228 TaxID=2763008 RepID=UPI001642CB79|nr:flagellar hook-associated protein FlgL [Nocardioides sp. zg-1228]MBC2932313.1 flagellar hook-associated protein FlgL [Nocardioides sp. zg-1228]QSF57831.1 flagellar hook-associated protein FlgL [Nocardioides sp. zg-1228]
MTTINRVTQSMLTDRSLDRLQGSLSRLAEIQEHLSTGRVLNRASDNPGDAATAMRLRASIGAQQQYARNAADGTGWLDTLDSTLGASNDLVRRARELGIQAVSGAAGPQSREALAVEIDQLRSALLGVANTTYVDRPVLGGTTAGSAAFTEAGGAVTFAGDAHPVHRTVADGVVVDVSLPGPAAFGADGDNVFDHLTALSAALRSGDETGIRAGVAALEDDGNRLVVARADVGARAARVERASTAAVDAELSLTSALAEIENADLPRTMVDLKMQEVAYQAALAATARVLQPSLMDFLR